MRVSLITYLLMDLKINAQGNHTLSFRAVKDIKELEIEKKNVSPVGKKFDKWHIFFNPDFFSEIQFD